MIIILVSEIKEHPKVPEIEQMFSAAAAAENILLAFEFFGIRRSLANWKVLLWMIESLNI